jgi:hypothetical protein
MSWKCPPNPSLLLWLIYSSSINLNEYIVIQGFKRIIHDHSDPVNPSFPCRSSKVLYHAYTTETNEKKSKCDENEIKGMSLCMTNDTYGKAIPLQDWTGPLGFRSLRLPDFKTVDTWRWEGCQPSALAAFTSPGIILATHFCYRLSQHQGHSVAGRIMWMKYSSDTSGNQTCDLPAGRAWTFFLNLGAS